MPVAVIPVRSVGPGAVVKRWVWGTPTGYSLRIAVWSIEPPLSPPLRPPPEERRINLVSPSIACCENFRTEDQTRTDSVEYVGTARPRWRGVSLVIGARPIHSSRWRALVLDYPTMTPRFLVSRAVVVDVTGSGGWLLLSYVGRVQRRRDGRLVGEEAQGR